MFDASGTTYADGLVHTSVTASYGYTVADGQGGTASADVSMRFCGTVNTLDTIADSLPAGGSMVINFSNAPNGPFFTAAMSGTGDICFDGVSVDNAYCVSIGSISFSPMLTDGIAARQVWAAELCGAYAPTVTDGGEKLEVAREECLMRETARAALTCEP